MPCRYHTVVGQMVIKNRFFVPDFSYVCETMKKKGHAFRNIGKTKKNYIVKKKQTKKTKKTYTVKSALLLSIVQIF